MVLERRRCSFLGGSLHEVPSCRRSSSSSCWCGGDADGEANGDGTRDVMGVVDVNGAAEDDEGFLLTTMDDPVGAIDPTGATAATAVEMLFL